MSRNIDDGDELATVLAVALKRCDESGRFFRGYHTPKTMREQPDVVLIRAAFANNPDDLRHGTENGYSNLRCRCDRCQAARPNQTGRAKPKEPPVSKVSDLFDPHPLEIEHGTLKGAKACRQLGELCFACARVVRAENRPHSASSSARGTTRAAETAKALEAHRRECAPLRAEVRAMIAAEKRSA